MLYLQVYSYFSHIYSTKIIISVKVNLKSSFLEREREREIMNAPAERKNDIFRYELMQPFDETLAK